MAKKAAKGAAAKKKRTVSGRRGKPGRKNNQGTDTRGVVGIVVFCIGFLALLCQFIPSDGGFLNRCMLVVRGLGGMLCLLLPVVLCWTGAVLVFFREKKWSTRTLILGSLIFLFVEAMFQLFRISGVNAALAADGVEANYGVFLVRSFTMSSLDCKGGGFIGALLAWPLYKALDVWGGMIVLIFATAIVLMAMTGFSFGGIGMRISEWIDDFRVDMQERREEKDALRDARQEEELERENALAIERQKRRQERLQKQKEEQEAAAKEAAEQEKRRQQEEEMRRAFEPEEPDQASEPPKTTRRKEKPTLTVVRPQEDERTDDRPVLTSRPPKRNAAPRKRREISDGAQLYIERDDEFTRAPVDEHAPTTPSRRNSFTMQEAESAFLYGMNGSQPTQSSAYQQQTASYAPTDAYGQPTAGYAPTDAYGQPTAGYTPTDTYGQTTTGYTPTDAYGQPTTGYAPTDAYSQPTNEEPTVEPDVSADAYAEEDDDEENSITNARAEGADR
ncbi:MAG: hypothetical protein U0H96_09255, partial [Christensenellales bacterium]|nr:hypothetical protein [Christensenellales bacterium]